MEGRHEMPHGWLEPVVRGRALAIIHGEVQARWFLVMPGQLESARDGVAKRVMAVQQPARRDGDMLRRARVIEPGCRYAKAHPR